MFALTKEKLGSVNESSTTLDSESCMAKYWFDLYLDLKRKNAEGQYMSNNTTDENADNEAISEMVKLRNHIVMLEEQLMDTQRHNIHLREDIIKQKVMVTELKEEKYQNE
jgi:hypothetical protein